MIRARIQGWLPAGSASRRFLLVSLIDSLGTGLFLASSALFFTRVVGVSVAQMGVALSLAGVAGFALSVPVGRIADRVGSRRALIAINLARAAGFAAYLFVGDFATFVVVACVLGIGERSSGPIVQAIVGAFEEGGSPVRTMAAVGVVRNAGFTIGALLATAAIAVNSPTAFRALVLANALSFVFAAVVLARLRLVPNPAPVREASESAMRVRDPRYLALTVLNGILHLHIVLLAVGLPLWIVTHTEAPEPVVGLAVVLNTVLAITLGVRLSRGVEGVRASAARQLWAGWSLAVCCALIAPTAGLDGAAATMLLLAATVALTLGEIWQSLGAWGLAYGLSPEHQRNFYLSVYYLGDAGATIVGPALFTLAVLPAGAPAWLILGAVFAVTGLAVRVIAGRAETVRAHPAMTAAAAEATR
jgi:MFS family permease